MKATRYTIFICIFLANLFHFVLKMANTIDQWRSAIGSFGGGTHSNTKKIVHGLSANGRSSTCMVIFSMLLVYSNITTILLLRAGIEANPGPINHNQSGKNLFSKILFQTPYLKLGLFNIRCIYFEMSSFL